MVQTKREIQAVLGKLGIRPRKRFGQHFLIDGNLMRRLAAAAKLGADDTVLEVGPGTGGLTDLLIEQAGGVVVAEIDRTFCEHLQSRFASAANFTLVKGDVLARKSALAADVIEAVRDRKRRNPAGRLLLVANLPYSISSPLLIDLLLSDLGFDRLCFTVQHEVAERILADPGTKPYGALSVILQTRCQCERIASVPRQAFWPQPEIASTMLRLDVTNERIATPDALRELADVVRTLFTMRRKTLGHSIRAQFGENAAEQINQHARLDRTRRCESLSIKEWIELADMLLRVTNKNG